ncbi:MAG TPA: hypothetical protein VN739_10740 [Nitrososphaerales archaeon]|nr:hypothetical protein [Nitrososphaerales archaeon]
MPDPNFEGTLGERLCQEIIALDGSIIFVSIGSLSGLELASARKPSAALLVGDDPKLRSRYSSLAAGVIIAFKQGENVLGAVNRIVTTFENFKLIVIPYFVKEAFVVVLTTRDSESNKIAFQVSKQVERFARALFSHL